MTRLVIRGVRWPGDVAIEDGSISAVGDVAVAAGDEVLDARGGIVTAGLVNGHSHLFQWLTRGRATGCGLFDWLVALYPTWGRLSVDDVAAAALVGLGELARSGCTTASDHHYLVPRGDDAVFDAVVDAARSVGIRLYLGRGSMDLSEKDGGLPPDDVVEDLDDILCSTEDVIARHHDGDLVNVVVAPCSPFSVTPRLMEESAALARRRGLRLHTHLAETLEEDEHCIARFGRRPLEQLEEWGWSGPDVWFAHGIHFDDQAVKRIGATSTGVAHCPTSNARLGAGIARTRDLLDAGARVGLGVDGAASNESASMLEEARHAVLFARARGGPKALGVRDALELATIGGARVLGREDDLGSIEPGKIADLALWRLDTIAHADITDPVAALILGSPPPLELLLVDGHVVVEQDRVVTVDESVIAREAAAVHKSLVRKAG